MIWVTLAAAALAAPRIEADLQPVYPLGRTIVVTLTVENDGAVPLTTPDLSSRPWLVHFELADAERHRQTRSSQAPPEDAGGTWEIAPGSRRQVVLTIPGSGGLHAGEWTVEVAIDELDLAHPQGTFTLRPVGVTAVDLAPARTETLVDLWIDGIRRPYQGYLRAAPSGRPDAELENWFVMSVDRPVLAPILSEATPGRPWVRHVVWLEGASLFSVAVSGRGVSDPIRRHDFPWPRVTLLGDAATDSEGRLVVPFWLPSPRGPGGMVQVAVVGKTGPIRFHKVTALDASPGSVDAIVDASGGVHLLVRSQHTVDRYVIRPELGANVPLPGERLLAVPVLDAGFTVLPDVGDQAGGLAVWTLVAEPDRFRIDWFGLDGSVKASRSIRGAGKPLAVLPAFAAPAVAIAAGNDARELSVLTPNGATRKSLPAGASGRWALYVTKDGAAGVRVFGADGRMTTL
jgi:hypothetical protein